MRRSIDELVKFHSYGTLVRRCRAWRPWNRDMSGVAGMVSYFVRYRGRPADPAAFARYYEHAHGPILQRFPGIRSLILHAPTPWHDPFPVRDDGAALLAQMTFDTTADLDRALQSDARRAARDDFARFPAFDGEVTHQAMTAKVIFR